MNVALLAASLVALLLPGHHAAPGTTAGVSRITITSQKPDSPDQPAGVGIVRYGLTRSDAQRIAATIPGLTGVVPVRRISGELTHAGNTAKGEVIGTTEDYWKVGELSLQRGRFLSARDQAKVSNVAVISSGAAERLFPKQDSLGRSVRIGSHFYRVVGQLADDGDTIAAYVPIRTMRSRMGDVWIRRDQGAFQAESFELTGLEVLVPNDRAARTQQLIASLLSTTHQLEDFRVAEAVPQRPAPPVRNGASQQETRTVLEAGVLESASAVTLSSGIPGQSVVIAILPEGTAVKKGEVVARLENSQLEQRLTQARVEVAVMNRSVVAEKDGLDAARVEAEAASRIAQLLLDAAKLERAQYFGPGGEHAVEVAALEREIAAAELGIAVAKKIAAKADQTGEVVMIAEARLREATARAQRDNARDAIKLLNGPTRKLKEKAFEVQIAEAEAQVAQHKARSTAERRAMQAELAAADAELQLARKRLVQLEQQIAAAVVRAPIDGIVEHAVARGGRTARPDVLEEGAIVRERQPLVRITDPKQIQVRVRVHESKIRSVAVGQECTVRVDALPDQQMTGVVKRVGNVPVPGTWPNTQVKEYEVIVTLNDKLDRLRIGMTCEVRIDVGEKGEERQ